MMNEKCSWQPLKEILIYSQQRSRVCWNKIVDHGPLVVTTELLGTLESPRELLEMVMKLFEDYITVKMTNFVTGLGCEQ